MRKEPLIMQNGQGEHRQSHSQGSATCAFCGLATRHAHDSRTHPADVPQPRARTAAAAAAARLAWSRAEASSWTSSSPVSRSGWAACAGEAADLLDLAVRPSSSTRKAARARRGSRKRTPARLQQQVGPRTAVGSSFSAGRQLEVADACTQVNTQGLHG